ncbi:MAG TPA: 4-alpha-glucanotransferase [Pseudomonas sp.]|nr:4-alpha-glucanotransferase [Pseudomonas sp.]
MSDKRLAELSKAVGLNTEWQDAAKQKLRVSPEAQRALLEAMGYPAQTSQQILESLATLKDRHRSRCYGPLLTVEQGQLLDLAGRFKPGSAFRLTEEGAQAHEGRLDTQARLPAWQQPGYHRLEIGDEQLTVAVCPPACPDVASLAGGEDRHLWGLAVQLYALRRQGDGGLGDTEALEHLVRSAAQAGADALALSPVHAMFSALPEHYSPYSPSSRLFFNVLHASPGCILGEHAQSQVLKLSDLEAELARLEALELIDWPAVGNTRLRILRELYRGFGGGGKENLLTPDFNSFCAVGGEALRDHCRFEALQAFQRAHGQSGDWRDWSESLRDPRHGEVERFAREHGEEVRFHAFCQWLIARCLKRAQDAAIGAGMRIGLIADLAVGAESTGSQAWSRQEEFLPALAVGAPPDLINRAGQNWGITAFSPEGLRQHGFRAYVEMLRANLAHVGGLRIDHAMGMQRLWLIPQGAPPEAGAYLDYPCADLLRLLCLEATRHRALIIGEDLGTVPPGFSEDLARRNILGMRVLYFEQHQEGFRPLAQWSDEALATSTTHDLPSIIGWLEGRDIEQRLASGHIDAQRARDDLAQREADRRALVEALCVEGLLRDGEEDPARLLDACVAFLGRTPAPLVLLPLEDVLGHPEQPNLPGPGDHHPNWRRRWPVSVDRLLREPQAMARLRLLDSSRQAGSRP